MKQVGERFETIMSPLTLSPRLSTQYVPSQASESDMYPKLNDMETKDLVSMLSKLIAANATQYYKMLILKSTTTYFRTFSQWEKHS